MRFNLLGPLEVLDDQGRPVPLAPKPGQLLALLLIDAGRVIPTEALIGELWGDAVPASARTIVQTYVYQLRKSLGGGSHASPRLRTSQSGYLVRIDDDILDLYEFDRLTTSGQRLLSRGDALSATAELRAALELWRGPVLSGVSAGPVLSRHRLRLEENRFNAIEMRIEADLQLGRHHELIGELKSLTATESHNELLHAQLIRALRRAGRRGEALAVYQRLERGLAETFEILPSAALRRLHADLLQADLGGSTTEPQAAVE
ncbi:AfsR/SARP family transcriptional regulator [Actinoplanes sp. NPDC048791]|uniref:AfsR/SARP family transcriptional regulator n=1 Tax=Actinoplanes sp. NPDC048791 TaxID=3154623 RepID=UPI00340E3552